MGVTGVLTVLLGAALVVMGAGRVLRWVARPRAGRALGIGLGLFTTGLLTVLGFGQQVQGLLVLSGLHPVAAALVAAVWVLGLPLALLLAEAGGVRPSARPRATTPVGHVRVVPPQAHHLRSVA